MAGKGKIRTDSASARHVTNPDITKSYPAKTAAGLKSFASPLIYG
jgi:hypothetical protein